jgi:hypothetical protein
MGSAVSIKILFTDSGRWNGVCMEEPRILYAQSNPYETYTVTVEEDGRTVYMYMSPTKDPDLEPRAVWVRNLLPAPEGTDHDAMKKGIAPLLKRSSCAHPDGLPAPESKDLGILWFQEGNGVVLYHNHRVEAVIPPWSGNEGLFGYAAQCLSYDVGTVPLTEENSGLFERVRENEIFWERRRDGDYWGRYRDALMAHYEKSWGSHTQYYAVTGRSYPPIGIALFSHEGIDLYATLGMSFQNMPRVEVSKKEPERFLRAEIVTARSESPEWLPGLLGRLALYPWLYNRFLDAGHTYESGMNHPDSDFLFTDRFGAPFFEGPEPFDSEGHPVRFLLALPLRQEDFLVIRARGSDHVLKRIIEKAGSAYPWP